MDIVYGYSPAHALDPDRSLRILERSVRKNPASLRNLFYLGKEYWQRGRLDAVIRLRGTQNWLVPDNRPDLDFFFFADLPAMAKLMDLPQAETRFFLEAGPAAKPGVKLPLTQDAHVSSLENKLRERLGTKVHLRYAHGKGALEITYFSDAELERILQLLGVTAD